TFWRRSNRGGRKPAIVAQTVCLLFRRLAVGGPPARRLPTCDTADCQSALHSRRRRRRVPTWPRAAPPPVFRCLTELRMHRIHPDVPLDARLLVVVANPVIVGLALPESFARPSQEQIGLSRSVAFAALEDFA